MRSTGGVLLALICVMAAPSMVFGRDVTVDVGYLDRPVPQGQHPHRLPAALPPDKVPHRKVEINTDDILKVHTPAARYPSDKFGWIEYHAEVTGYCSLLPVLRTKEENFEYFQARGTGPGCIVVGLKNPGQEAITPACYLDVIVYPVGGKGHISVTGKDKPSSGHLKEWSGRDNPSVQPDHTTSITEHGANAKPSAENSVKSYDWKSLPPK